MPANAVMVQFGWGMDILRVIHERTFALFKLNQRGSALLLRQSASYNPDPRIPLLVLIY
jgi:hypothetical protein